MRILIGAFVAALTAGGVGVMPVEAARVPPTTAFYCTGAEQTYSVPKGIKGVTIEALGARGEAPSGATPSLGAHVTATVPLARGTTTLYIEVGCRGTGHSTLGFNGGGYGGSTAYAGGGASDVRLAPRTTALTTSDTRLVVAGGGGGMGVCWIAGGSAGYDKTGPGNGGDGGASGIYCDSQVGGNGGKFGTAGGAGGANAYTYPGVPGTLGNGGSSPDGSYGGGGGGGYYGGGSGGDGNRSGGGGGAGSSYWPSTTAINVTMVTAAASDYRLSDNSAWVKITPYKGKF